MIFNSNHRSWAVLQEAQLIFDPPLEISYKWLAFTTLLPRCCHWSCWLSFFLAPNC
jgi:hypothetical protein